MSVASQTAKTVKLLAEKVNISEELREAVKKKTVKKRSG